MLIVNTITHDRGWSPIQHMVTTAATIFDSEVVAAEPRGITANTKILSILRQRIRNTNSNEVCLVVCKGPTDLLAVHKIDNWRRRFRYLAAWIIDSFWLDHLPTSIRLRNPFDHIFVTSLEDVDLWKKITGVATTWLPWGTDALRLGQAGGPREWDLTRVGRQPPEWENDFDAASAAELLGIKYRGRPDSSGLSTLQNQQMMMHSYGSTKFTLAFSNAVNRDPNNHPTREYLTGRWVDALGSGSIVAGVAPRGPNTDELLWRGATLELGGVRRTEGLQVVAAAIKSWTPDVAACNYRMALSRLDWRWRFKALAEVCGIECEELILELRLLEQRIAELAVNKIPA